MLIYRTHIVVELQKTPHMMPTKCMKQHLLRPESKFLHKNIQIACFHHSNQHKYPKTVTQSRAYHLRYTCFASLPAPSSFKCYVETPKASIGHISHTAYKHITQIGNFHQVVTRRKFFTYHFFFFSCPGQIS
jgi:hypothetical protein